MKNSSSEQLNELFAALSKAQGQIQGVVKDATNPFFKSQYTSLDSCWDACRGPLSANGLSVVQTVDESEGKMVLCTILGHSSGQYISSRVPLIMAKPDPQSFGSAVSYLRRYSLCAMVGLTQSDDDGEHAMQSFRKKDTPLKSTPLVEPSISQEEFMEKIYEKFGDKYSLEGIGEYLSHLEREKNVKSQQIMIQALTPTLTERFCAGWQKWKQSKDSSSEWSNEK